jgi:hypothetical protein
VSQHSGQLIASQQPVGMLRFHEALVQLPQLLSSVGQFLHTAQQKITEFTQQAQSPVPNDNTSIRLQQRDAAFAEPRPIAAAVPADNGPLGPYYVRY